MASPDPASPGPRTVLKLRHRGWYAALLGLAAVVLLATLPGVRQRALRAARSFRRVDRHPRLPGPTELRPSTPDGISVFVVDDSTKVFRGDALGQPRETGEGAAPVRMHAARGETVAFQLAVASSRSGSRVDVDPSDLTGPGGRIPRGQLEVLLESYLDCGEVDAKVVTLGPGHYPDPLIPLWESGPGSRPVAAPFPLLEGQNQVLWVDVTVPRAAAAGTYAGSLTLRPDGRAAIILPLALEVHPFEIPARSRLTAWVPVYAGRLRKAEGLLREDRLAARRVVWEYYRMARRHRFVTQIMEDEPELQFDTASGALLHCDWADYDALNAPALDGRLFEDGEPPALWKVGGFVEWGADPEERPHFGGNYRTDAALTPAHRRALVEYAREIGRHFREQGWAGSRTFMYMIDEPDFREQPNLEGLIRSYGEAIRESGTGIAHLVTMAPDSPKAPLGTVDIWATWGAGYHPRAMAERQRQGERTWFYQQHEPFVGGNCVNDEGLGLRSWPWIAWRYGVDGVFLWVGNFWNDDPYRVARNWNADLLGNGVLFYPGARLPSLGYPAIASPVSSFRMKTLRRGLLDYAYFEILKGLGGDPDALVAKVVRSALNDQAYEPYWTHPLWARHGDWSHDPADWDAVRLATAREISSRLSAPATAAGLGS
jgi:Domain of unknown function (DUF4091)